MGINIDGRVDVLGIWLSDLKSRGVTDILIACTDGLKGFPQAIEAIFPKTQVQLWVVHQIRTSLRYFGSKYHKEFMVDLKEFYRADNHEIAEINFKKLEQKWGDKCPSAVQGWRSNWTNPATYFQFPAEVRKMSYTTNAVEALHRQYRKVTKTKGAFPTDDALKKMLYLATLHIKGAFGQNQNWPVTLGQLKIVFGDRIPENTIQLMTAGLHKISYILVMSKFVSGYSTRVH